jgi:hypothetical protein
VMPEALNERVPTAYLLRVRFVMNDFTLGRLGID